MDGCPDRGEVIPIRMYMNGIELSPSYENIHNRLSVKYWINLVLIDEEDRRYFKQTEITIYRKPWFLYLIDMYKFISLFFKNKIDFDWHNTKSNGAFNKSDNNEKCKIEIQCEKIKLNSYLNLMEYKNLTI